MEQKQDKFIIIDPYNDKHIHLVKDFERQLDNHLPCQLSDILLNIRKYNTKEEYLTKKTNKDMIEENLYLVHDGKLVSSCFIEGSKKTKTCNFTYITLPKYRRHGFARKLLNFAFDYVINFHGIETVELAVNYSNEESSSLAKKEGFHLTNCIGTERIYQRSITDSGEEVKQL